MPERTEMAALIELLAQEGPTPEEEETLRQWLQQNPRESPRLQAMREDSINDPSTEH